MEVRYSKNCKDFLMIAMNSETIEAVKPWLNFIHPLLMWGILALTLYAAYLG
mgnify:FL=1